jgi:hypothetical protein
LQIKVLAQEGTQSAPEHILKLLDDYKGDYQIAESDELWLVIDVDRWGDEKLSQIATACTQKGYKLAVSNPAIELWFLLHLTNVRQYTLAEQAALLANKKEGKTRTRLEREIIKKIGRYNKSNLNVDDFLPHLETAIKHAKKLNPNPADRWPQKLGTQVYLLAEAILRLSQSWQHRT